MVLSSHRNVCILCYTFEGLHEKKIVASDPIFLLKYKIEIFLYRQYKEDMALWSSGEFEALPFKEADVSLCTTGSMNMDKNRYGNILPPDSTRIILDNGKYINANMIDLDERGSQMIACQGPLDYTIEDFWSMILQHHTNVILMVTPLVEKGNVKCAKYWPEPRKISQYGRIKILNLYSNQVSTSLIVSRLLISSPLTKRLVYHIYYYGMPDFGAVKDLDEIYLVLCILISLSTSKLFVCHCSADVGRTGVIAAILRCLRTEEPPIKAISVIRKQRHGMVQTKLQFRMIRSLVNQVSD